MANSTLPDRKLFDKVWKLKEKGVTITEIARRIDVPRSTVTFWVVNHDALLKKFVSAAAPLVPVELQGDKIVVPETAILKDKIRGLEAQLKAMSKEQLDAHYVRSKIFKLADAKSEPPAWLCDPKESFSSPGVPTLFASDWHWGEVVDGTQIGSSNFYDIGIAHRRARAFVDHAVDLLTNHMVNPNYPGVVLALGGDMVSGDIHEELLATNEMEIMPTVVDLHGVLVWVIRTLADKFGKVFVPCVGGNHGRNTHKIRAKGRNFTSFDWLLYIFLEKTFNPIDPVTGERGEGYDDRVQFSIPNGSDCLYSIYGHRYLLTHGDQFRGGDGVIGALGPIIRGDHKKRSRNGQIGMEYDTMIIGHWHQLIQLQRLIVNGSLKGYDEYAYQGNFPFELPRQALWITHPQHGITFSMPVLVETDRNKDKQPWIEWKDKK